MLQYYEFYICELWHLLYKNLVCKAEIVLLSHKKLTACLDSGTTSWLEGVVPLGAVCSRTLISGSTTNWRRENRKLLPVCKYLNAKYISGAMSAFEFELTVTQVVTITEMEHDKHWYLCCDSPGLSQVFGIELPPHPQTLHVYTQALRHAAEQLHRWDRENVTSIQAFPLLLESSCGQSPTHLFLHVVGAVRCGSGEKWRQVCVQCVLRLGSKWQHLYPRVQVPQLLLQTEHNSVKNSSYNNCATLDSS